MWYTAASGGTLLQTTTGATSSTYTTPSISTTTTYYVEFTNGTCTTARAAVAATVLTLPATLTKGEALGVVRGLKPQVTAMTDGVVLDASTLTQFDSSALAVILACRREAVAAGKTFAVHCLPARLTQLAALYGVAELIPSAI